MVCKIISVRRRNDKGKYLHISSLSGVSIETIDFGESDEEDDFFSDILADVVDVEEKLKSRSFIKKLFPCFTNPSKRRRFV